MNFIEKSFESKVSNGIFTSLKGERTFLSYVLDIIQPLVQYGACISGHNLPRSRLVPAPRSSATSKRRLRPTTPNGTAKEKLSNNFRRILTKTSFE